MVNKTTERLIEALNDMNMTQADLSRRTGLGRPAISQYISGKVKPKQDNVFLLAKALQVSPTWLMGFNVPKYPIPEDFYEDNYHDEKTFKSDYDLADMLGGDDEINYVILKAIFETLKESDRDMLEKIRITIKIMLNDNRAYNLISNYRSLEECDKELINCLTERLSPRRQEPKEFIALQPPLLIPYYGHIASAGTGQYVFDDIPPEMIEIENEMDNMQVDFAIGVNGDSMEPTYRDGDTLLIKKQSEIHIGEVGIFMIGGEAFVKELGNGVLISHNKKYKDIHINDSVICLGKVISKHIS